MKLAAIADLHVDINKSYPVLECLAGYLEDEGADGVLTVSYTHLRTL